MYLYLINPQNLSTKMLSKALLFPSDILFLLFHFLLSSIEFCLSTYFLGPKVRRSLSLNLKSQFSPSPWLIKQL